MTLTLTQWSVEDYHAMIAAGILQDRRVELLAGDIVEMTPESPLHYSSAKQGTRHLESLLGDRAEVRFNGPITLANSEPEPDIAIVHPPATRYTSRHPGPADVFWVVEVSQSSRQKDLSLKQQIYAQAGIPEYWLVDLVARQLWVFRDLQNNIYNTTLKLQQGPLSPLAFPDVVVEVERFLVI
ncbi:MAG: Uma2 family endonuclease [Cyanobacteria bacterium P01_G01_bin.54]